MTNHTTNHIFHGFFKFVYLFHLFLFEYVDKIQKIVVKLLNYQKKTFRNKSNVPDLDNTTKVIA